MMRINLSFPDMTLVKLTNITQESIVSIKPQTSKYVWFSYKFVKEFSMDIVDAINEGKLLTSDYNNNIIPFYDSAYEISRLCRDVKKYPNGYLWNKYIGILVKCKLQSHIDSFNLTIDESKNIINSLDRIFKYLGDGYFKECIDELSSYIPNRIITKEIIDEYSLILSISDGI